jgi:hypothetical protein
MIRWKLAPAALGLLMAVACGGGSSLPVPEPRPEADALAEDVDRLLELLDVEGVLGARDRAFTRQVAIMIGDPSDAELERLVDAVLTSFAYDSLRADVAEYMVSEGSAEVVERACNGWTGAPRRPCGVSARSTSRSRRCRSTQTR